MQTRRARGLRRLPVMVQVALILVLLSYARAFAAIISFISPSSGTTVNGSVPISVKTSSRVAWVNFSVDNHLLAAKTTDTYDWNSTTVSNGTHTVTVSGYKWNGSLLQSASEKVNVKNSSTASGPTPTPTPTPTATPTSTPDPTATPTSTPDPPSTSTSCPTAPALVNPQNPVNYGADPTGGTDSTTAFSNALANGDLQVPSGTFLINGHISVPSNRNIQCAGSGLTVLKETNGCNYTEQMFDLQNSDTVYNCGFWGPNANRNAVPCAGSYGSFFLRWSGDSVTVVGNDFNGINGYVAALVIGSTSTVASNSTVCGNTFEHCGYNAWQLSQGNGVIIEHNTMNDCSGDVEANNSSASYTNNIVNRDSYTFTYGIGNNKANGGTGFDGLTCGNALGANYSGNTCENNTIDGTHTSGLVESCGGGYNCTPAAYINNTCTGGCQVNQYD